MLHAAINAAVGWEQQANKQPQDEDLCPSCIIKTHAPQPTRVWFWGGFFSLANIPYCENQFCFPTHGGNRLAREGKRRSCFQQHGENCDHVKIPKRGYEPSEYEDEVKCSLTGKRTRRVSCLHERVRYVIDLAGKHAYCLQSSRTSLLTCLTSPDTAAVPHIHRSTQETIFTAAHQGVHAAPDPRQSQRNMQSIFFCPLQVACNKGFFSS